MLRKLLPKPSPAAHHGCSSPCIRLPNHQHGSPGREALPFFVQWWDTDSKMSVSEMQDDSVKGSVRGGFGNAQGRLKDALQGLELDNRGFRAFSNHVIDHLQQCDGSRALTLGKQIPDLISETSLTSNFFLRYNTLNMHLKCGSVINARQVFGEMPERGVFSWTAMIPGYGNGQAVTREIVSWNSAMSRCIHTGCGLNTCVERMHALKPKEAGSSVLQANSYNGSSSSRFDDKAKVRQLMESRGLRKEPGWSRIEINSQVFTFLVDDMSHPQSKEIRVELQRLLKIMKEGGYTADLRCVLRDIPEEEKENALLHHSERLAMALGHMCLPPKAPLRVIKNLRVCNDCHVATKYLSKIMEREIIVRDATRFHHFKDGICSCGDYW